MSGTMWIDCKSFIKVYSLLNQNDIELLFFAFVTTPSRENNRCYEPNLMASSSNFFLQEIKFWKQRNFFSLKSRLQLNPIISPSHKHCIVCIVNNHNSFGKSLIIWRQIKTLTGFQCFVELEQSGRSFWKTIRKCCSIIFYSFLKRLVLCYRFPLFL